MYKNWQAIGGVQDVHFKWALTLLDITTDFGRQMAGRFPEYFTQAEPPPPVALSSLRRDAKEVAAGLGFVSNGGRQNLVAYEAIPHWMPMLSFADSSVLSKLREDLPDLQPLPVELSDVKEVGSVCIWAGKKLVLVDYPHDGHGQRFFVPAEFIDVDR